MIQTLHSYIFHDRMRLLGMRMHDASSFLSADIPTFTNTTVQPFNLIYVSERFDF